MPTAIVTGASRGLGLALASALAERGWRLVIDAREAGTLDEAATALSKLTDVAALPGDVADPEHRADLIAAAGGRVDLLVNNASVLGPSPQPALTDYPLDTLEHVYRVNVFAPLALIQCRATEPRPQRHLRRRRRGLRRLGRVRLVQGRARPPQRRARPRAPRAARLRRRPRRHEHAHAPGGVPGRGHLRPPAARTSVPGLLALIEGDLPERPLPGAGAGRPRDARSTSPSAAPGGRDAAAPSATRSGCWSPSPAARWSTRTSSTSPTSWRPATCWSSTPRRRCPPR